MGKNNIMSNSYRSENEINKPKIKNVIDQITRGIGEILEENLSGCMKDLNEVHKLFMRSSLYNSIITDNAQLRIKLKILQNYNS